MSVMKIFEVIRHELAVLVFALVIPLYAFQVGYNSSPSEMLNGILVPLSKAHIQSTKNLYLSTEFTPFDPAYIDAIVTIENAPANSEINLTIKNNFGGLVEVLDMLQKAIIESKAYITLTVTNFGWSCGTDILLMGNVLRLPNDSVLGFHTGSLGNETILPSFATGTPAQREAWESIVKLTKPYLKWFTKEEYKLWNTGAAVFITGRQICQDSDRTVDILYHYSDSSGSGCYIRGLKK